MTKTTTAAALFVLALLTPGAFAQKDLHFYGGATKGGDNYNTGFLGGIGIHPGSLLCRRRWPPATAQAQPGFSFFRSGRVHWKQPVSLGDSLAYSARSLWDYEQESLHGVALFQ